MYNLKKIVYFWLCWVSVAAQAFSLVAEGRSSSPGALRGLLTVAASLLKHRLEHRLEVGGFQHSGLSSRGTKSELLHDM